MLVARPGFEPPPESRSGDARRPQLRTVTISEQFIPEHHATAGSHPSYRHEEPASPNTCMNLLTGGFLVRVQAEEPNLQSHQSVTAADLATACSAGNRRGDLNMNCRVPGISCNFRWKFMTSCIALPFLGSLQAPRTAMDLTLLRFTRACTRWWRGTLSRTTRGCIGCPWLARG